MSKDQENFGFSVHDPFKLKMSKYRSVCLSLIKSRKSKCYNCHKQSTEKQVSSKTEDLLTG